MNNITTLQTFRCTSNRTFSAPVDPDHHHQAIHKLWTLVKANGQAPRMGTTALVQTPAATGAHPLPHSGTVGPKRPSPPPRSLIRKVTNKVSRVTRHTNPSTDRTPYPTKTSREHPHQSVKIQPPDKLHKMQCMDTPYRRRVLLASGISLLLLVTAGAATFGVITSNMRPVMDNETFTRVSGHQIQRRDINDTASDNPNDVNAIISLARERAAIREEAQKKTQQRTDSDTNMGHRRGKRLIFHKLGRTGRRLR